MEEPSDAPPLFEDDESSLAGPERDPEEEAEAAEVLQRDEHDSPKREGRGDDLDADIESPTVDDDVHVQAARHGNVIGYAMERGLLASRRGKFWFSLYFEKNRFKLPRTEMQTLYDWMNRPLLMLFAWFVFAALLLFMIVGWAGPVVLKEEEHYAYRCIDQSHFTFDPTKCPGVQLYQDGAKWTGNVNGLELLNEEWALEMIVFNKLYRTDGIKKSEFKLNVLVEGRDKKEAKWSTVESVNTTRKLNCNEGEQRCDALIVAHEPYIDYSDYQVTVETLNSESDGYWMSDVLFIFVYVNKAFVIFEFAFRYFFFFVSCNIAFIGLLMVCVRRLRWKELVNEQRWNVLLLFGLMCYENPFYAFDVVVASWIFPLINNLLLVFFLGTLFLYWIVLIDPSHGMPDHPKKKKRGMWWFYVPRIVLVSAAMMILWATTTWTALHSKDHPTYTAAGEMFGFTMLMVVELVILVCWLLWFLYGFFRGCGSLHRMQFRASRYKFFSTSTLLMGFLILGALVFGWIGPRNYVVSSYMYLTILAGFHLYVYSLFIMYLPIRRPKRPLPGEEQGVLPMGDLDEFGDERDEYGVLTSIKAQRLDDDPSKNVPKLSVVGGGVAGDDEQDLRDVGDDTVLGGGRPTLLASPAGKPTVIEMTEVGGEVRRSDSKKLVDAKASDDESVEG